MGLFIAMGEYPIIDELGPSLQINLDSRIRFRIQNPDYDSGLRFWIKIPDEESGMKIPDEDS